MYTYIYTYIFIVMKLTVIFHEEYFLCIVDVLQFLYWYLVTLRICT